MSLSLYQTINSIVSKIPITLEDIHRPCCTKILNSRDFNVSPPQEYRCVIIHARIPTGSCQAIKVEGLSYAARWKTTFQMYCAFQHSALYHCRVHLSCHFESFISESTSASVTRIVDLPLKNGHSTHSLSLCSYFKLYFKPHWYFTYPSLCILHAYI